MKKLFLLVTTLFIATVGFSQFDSENVTMKGRFDNDSLPEHNFGTFNDVWGYVQGDREYAIMGSASFIHFFDVTDPTNIEQVATVEPGTNTSWRDFKVYADHAYAVSDNSGEGMLVIDLSDLPNSVEVVKTMKDEFTSSHNVYLEVETGRLYVVGANPSGSYIYDVATDPANPAFLGHANMNGRYVHDIYVRDNIAYASSGNDGFYIWDLTDPNSQKLIADVETNGYNHSSWLTEDGKYAIFAEEVPTGLPMGIMELENMMDGDIQVNNYFKFPLLAPVETGATPHNPYVLGDYAFTSYYQDGLIVLDISDPTNPTRAGYFDTYPSNTSYPGYQGAWGCYPYLPSGNILISDMENGLFILEFNNDPSAVENEAAKQFTVFPNPTNGLINLQAELASKGSVAIYSSTGQLMSQQIMEQGFQNVEIDLGDYAKGMYFLQLESDEGVSVKKVNVF